MSKWVVDIHGDIEGDYEIVKKYEEPQTDALDKIIDEIELHRRRTESIDPYDLVGDCLDIINEYKAESEE